MKESAARTRVLDVASRLFYEQGYNSTGINQIIDEAEIARASLYNHFSSKKDLLSTYIQHAENLYFEELESAIGHIKNPKKKIFAFFDYRIAKQIETNFGGCRFTKIGAELPKDDLLSFELINHHKNRLKEYLTVLVKKINISKELLLNEKMLAETIFLLFEGAIVNASISKKPDPLKEARKIIQVLLG